MRQSRDQAWLKFSIIEGLPWILRSFSLDFPAQRSPQLPKNQESGMHIPCDSMILPRLRNPQVWGISDPSKIHLEQLEPGVFPVYFWISAPGVHLDAPPSCFSKGKNREKNKFEIFPLPPRPPRSAGGKKRIPNPTWSCFHFFPYFSPV